VMSGTSVLARRWRWSALRGAGSHSARGGARPSAERRGVRAAPSEARVILRYHGVLSSHAKLRPVLVPSPPEPEPDPLQLQAELGLCVEPAQPPRRNPWAWLLKHVFDLTTSRSVPNAMDPSPGSCSPQTPTPSR